MFPYSLEGNKQINERDKTDRQTDRQTDRERVFKVRARPSRHETARMGVFK